MKNRNDFYNKGLHEMLQYYPSEDILAYVQEREDVYIENWYGSDDITSNTGLLKQYHLTFIKYCNKVGLCQPLEEAVEHWVDVVKWDLHIYFREWAIENLRGDYCAFLDDYLEIDYNEDLGFISVFHTRFIKDGVWIADSMQEKVFIDLITELQIGFCDLKAYIEGKAQELINKHFS